MVQTARTLITRAMRRNGILAEGEDPSAAQASDALDTLNEMLNGFIADGINYSHTDLSLNSTMNFPDEELKFVRDMFSNELMPEYGLDNAQIAGAANKARTFLQARYVVVAPAPVDPALRPRRWWNTETGDYE